MYTLRQNTDDLQLLISSLHVLAIQSQHQQIVAWL